jgi:hypothetical protein
VGRVVVVGEDLVEVGEWVPTVSSQRRAIASASGGSSPGVRSRRLDSPDDGAVDPLGRSCDNHTDEGGDELRGSAESAGQVFQPRARGSRVDTDRQGTRGTTTGPAFDSRHFQLAPVLARRTAAAVLTLDIGKPNT